MFSSLHNIALYLMPEMLPLPTKTTWSQLSFRVCFVIGRQDYVQLRPLARFDWIMVSNIYAFWYVLIRNKDIFNPLRNCQMNVEHWNATRRAMIVTLTAGTKAGGFFNEKLLVWKLKRWFSLSRHYYIISHFVSFSHLLWYKRLNYLLHFKYSSWTDIKKS